MKWAYLDYPDLCLLSAPLRALIPLNLFMCSARHMESPHDLPKMPG
jgi:hypothetical protein